MNDGLTEEEARLKANRKLNGVNLDQFMSSYSTLIQYILQLKNGKLHSKGIKVVEDGMDYQKAVKVAIREYKHVLENYLDEVIDNENSDEDAASGEDDDNDDDDDEEEEVEEEGD